MAERRVGLWLIGALGSVGSTVALGLAALRRKDAGCTGLVTETPPFQGIDLDPPAAFVLGGHDIRQGDFAGALRELQSRSNIFSLDLIESNTQLLGDWSAEVRPGTLHHCGQTIRQLANRTDLPADATPSAAIARLRADLEAFKTRRRLDQVVVINVSSTEPPEPPAPLHQSLAQLRQALDHDGDAAALPASSLYALAALELGWPYVNFTPSLGASFPAALELAEQTAAAVAGQDGKTGETLLKTVLAPMFAARNLRVLSWVGHNIFGNRDGLVLSDPQNKAAKVRSKDQALGPILGYQPQTHVSIEYIESLDDWKTAWDHVHFEGFLGVKMMLQFTWQGCDSILAAPLVIDLARLALLAQRRGERGVLRHFAPFFKNPLGETDMDFHRQHARLVEYAELVKQGR
jgi:myo-inositol-1-phosphate synthase